MNKNFLKLLILFLLIAGGAFILQKESKAFDEKGQEKILAPVNNASGNRVWVGTFQLVWNDLMNDIVKGPVEFAGEDSKLADVLNEQNFNSSMLNEKSYYKTHGQISKKLKKQITKGIKRKFKEKSDIIEFIDWNSNGYLIYAMLKKNFEYLTKFPMLKEGNFNNQDKKVKYFGIDRTSNNEQLRKNVTVLFYNSKDDYAVKLNTKSKDEVILYRTDDNKELISYVKDVFKKSKEFKGDREFKDDDTIKVPVIKFKEMFNYNELTGKQIKNTDFTIDGAIQTVEFNLDNKGGSLKSEAALMMRMSLPIVSDERHFNFDKPFVILLKDKNDHPVEIMPYFILNIVNDSILEK